MAMCGLVCDMQGVKADRAALLLEADKMVLSFDFEGSLEPEDHLDGLQAKARQDQAVVCKHWLRGLCKKGDMCEFLHEYDLSRMPVCFFFTKYGECSNADCVYRHITVEENVKDCPWYDRGFCKHGNMCRNKHQRKIACENYLVGFCPEGPACKFGHPKFELPKEDAPGPVSREAFGIRAPPPDQIRPGRTPIVCHRCGQPGHKVTQCSLPPGPPLGAGAAGAGGGAGGEYPAGDKGPPRPLETVTCFKCGQTGHYANKCTNRRVPPPPGGFILPSGKVAIPPAFLNPMGIEEPTAAAPGGFAPTSGDAMT